MIFYSNIKKPKRIHLGENILSRLKNLFENSEDEGGIFHIKDIDDKKNMSATYEYVPDDDNIYADYTDYAKKNKLLNKDKETFNDKAGKTPYGPNPSIPLQYNLGYGDMVKNPDNMDIDEVPVNGEETIECFNLSMLGDLAPTLIAHTYKGKTAAYPGEKGYSITVTGEDGSKKPNLIKGEYAKKLTELIKGYPQLRDFSPNWIIYPESSSPFNQYIGSFLAKVYNIPSDHLIDNGTLVKTDFWGIDYKTLIQLGVREIKGTSTAFANCYSKFRPLRNYFYKEYFLKQLVDILEPRICKLIPAIRKMYYLENNLNGNVWKLIKNERNNTNESKDEFVLSPYGRLLEAGGAAGFRSPEEISNYVKTHPEIWGEDYRALVRLEEVPEIENALAKIDTKYGTDEVSKMNHFVKNGEMSSEERLYLIDNIQDYFMSEIDRFNEAAKETKLPLNFNNATLSEEILLSIFRNIVGHTKGKKENGEMVEAPMVKVKSGVGARTNEGISQYLSNYETFRNAFVNGIFSFNMSGVLSNSKKTDTVKNYPYVSRMSLFNQFEFSDKINKYPIKPEDRVLIIDDNFATGASFKNAANVIHDGLGIPYNNIKALTPGDMGTASFGGKKGAALAYNVAENYVLQKFKSGAFDDLKNQKFSFEGRNGAKISMTVGKFMNARAKAAEGNHEKANALRNAQDGNLSKSSSDFLTNDEEFDLNDVKPLKFKQKDLKNFMLPSTLADIEANKASRAYSIEELEAKIAEAEKILPTITDKKEKSKIIYGIRYWNSALEKLMGKENYEKWKLENPSNIGTGKRGVQKDSEDVLADKIRDAEMQKMQLKQEFENYSISREEYDVELRRINQNLKNWKERLGVPKAKEFKLRTDIPGVQKPAPAKTWTRGRKSDDAETLKLKIKKYEPLLSQLSGYEKYKLVNNINRWKKQLASMEGGDRTSKPFRMAADNVQRTPTPVARKEKIDISKPLTNQTKQTTRADLLNNIGKLNVKISNLDKKIRSYPLTHPDRAVKVKELENLKGERAQLKKEIERLTTNYG